MTGVDNHKVVIIGTSGRFGELFIAMDESIA
jgi:hypothetical protein